MPLAILCRSFNNARFVSLSLSVVATEPVSFFQTQISLMSLSPAREIR